MSLMSHIWKHGFSLSFACPLSLTASLLKLSLLPKHSNATTGSKLPLDTDQPDSGTWPRRWHYFLTVACSAVIHWGHTAKVICHPGVSRTTSLLKRCFGWNTLKWDAREYITPYTICACSKLSTQRPYGLLQPLSTQWSHIMLDFVSGLPMSSEKQ